MAEPEHRHLIARTEQGVQILRVTEHHLRSDDLADALREELLAAAGRPGADKVALDLQNVESISSAGLRPLLALRKALQERGGRLILCHLTPDVAEVLHVTRLTGKGGEADTFFQVDADVAAAVRRLSAAGPGGSGEDAGRKGPA